MVCSIHTCFRMGFHCTHPIVINHILSFQNTNILTIKDLFKPEFMFLWTRPSEEQLKSSLTSHVYSSSILRHVTNQLEKHMQENVLQLQLLSQQVQMLMINALPYKDLVMTLMLCLTQFKVPDTTQRLLTPSLTEIMQAIGNSESLVRFKAALRVAELLPGQINIFSQGKMPLRRFDDGPDAGLFGKRTQPLQLIGSRTLQSKRDSMPSKNPKKK